MTSIFQKARILLLGNLHGLLDSAIDMNSVSALKQYVRDLETANNNLADETARAKADVENIKRRKNGLEAKIAEDTSKVDQLLSDNDPTNDKFAESIAMRITGNQKDLDALGAEMAESEENAGNLAEAQRKVAAKLSEMKGQLDQLERMARSTDAKNRAARAVETASASTAGVPSVDNIGDRLRKDAAVANDRFARSLGGISDAADDAVERSAAREFLEKRAAQLKSAKAA